MALLLLQVVRFAGVSVCTVHSWFFLSSSTSRVLRLVGALETLGGGAVVMSIGTVGAGAVEAVDATGAEASGPCTV